MDASCVYVYDIDCDILINEIILQQSWKKTFVFVIELDLYAN